MFVPMIKGLDKGAQGSYDEGIYGLSSSFEVTKSSPRGSLPNPCTMLYLGLGRQGDLVL